jgi:hypothetical protein
MTARLCNSLLALTLLTCSFALAHDDAREAEEEQTGYGRVLGKLDFPTSTQSAEAQAAFEQGVLLLHLFEYPYAEAEFQRAQLLDPDFAMAYWGEAIVHNYSIWDEQAPDKALAVLNRFAPTPDARAARIASARERDFFRSLEILYGPAEGRRTKAERDRAYERFLGEMAKRYPDDHEVRLFYALAIMGTHAGVRDIPDYMESAALSQSVFHANRQHPGAVHYLIHAVDDPIHAPLGLEAARTLYVIAPRCRPFPAHDLAHLQCPGHVGRRGDSQYQCRKGEKCDARRARQAGIERRPLQFLVVVRAAAAGSTGRCQGTADRRL